MEKLEFQFTIYKVQNLANGGYRLAMDIPSIHAKEAAMLLVHADSTGVVGKAIIELVREDTEYED